MENGSVDLARRLADQFVCRDFCRPAPLPSPNFFKFSNRRCCHRRLPYLDCYASAGKGFLFLDSLNPVEVMANMDDKLRTLIFSTWDEQP